ncbi:methyl-accepting chemotaxis protein [Marinobacter halodurans]|uniref:Methyl-accepting chemotaxis protein n=1 Tax=Marinobacter halodurans TaxID=2528979 RepID=A0ABY1ZE99_9GAMM|nr:methyl-accepting chemotaxis protein [Marinobacter halodurans]TBW48235.1 methyl-accepting chemotaxis protein [Marinobacter halodurans]
MLSQTLNRISVGKKLVAGFFILVILTIVISVTGALALESYAHRARIVAGVGDIKAALMDARNNERGFQLRRESHFMEAAGKSAREAAGIARNLRSKLVVPDDQERVDLIIDNAGRYEELLKDYKKALGTFGSDASAIESQLSDTAAEAINTAMDLRQVQLEHMDEDYDSALTTIVATSILAAIAASLLGWTMTRSITRPIRETLAIADAVADGNLTVDTSSERGDEFGQLLNTFGRMVRSLRKLIREIDSGAASIGSAAEELSTVTQQTSAAVESQRDKTDQVATAMNQMAATVSEVARSAESAFETAKTANDKSAHGDHAVRETLENVADLKSQIDNVMEEMLGLQSETQNIATILDVIKAVAEQTNLLALNAAIEAARAGEHGRGFAVVADEVRSLARRAQDSATEIETLITNLVNSADTSKTSMERGTELAGQTLARAESTRDTIRDVVQSVEDIRQYNNQIATAAEEQASVAEDINRNVTEIREDGEQTANATQQVSSSSNELARLAENLTRQIARFQV